MRKNRKTRRIGKNVWGGDTVTKDLKFSPEFALHCVAKMKTAVKIGP